MKIFRTITAVLLAAFLLLGPRLVHVSRRAIRTGVQSVATPEARVSVTIYHIVSARTYAGSLTSWLKSMAEKYEKKHKGVYLTVEGMTDPYYAERVAYGRMPDGYSFFSGALDADALQPIGLTSDELTEGLFDTEYAVPYGYSGYAAVTASGNAPLPEANAVAALVAGSTEGIVCDLCTAGDRLRSEEYGGTYALTPIGSFTDQVAWLGIAREADAQKAEVLRGFYAFLREEPQQRALAKLGAYPALAAAQGEAVIDKAIDAAYAAVETVDPFAYAACRDALRADAAAALAGDRERATQFWERLRQILWK